jgi:hypothetical protein
MAEMSAGVVVTEVMLTEAARAGDLQSLTIWAEDDVRVTTARVRFLLLLVAATLHLCGSW